MWIQAGAPSCLRAYLLKFDQGIHDFKKLHTLKKDVIWILYIFEEKIWIWTVSNLRVKTAEHSYWANRPDTCRVWIGAVQWQKLVFVMVVPSMCKLLPWEIVEAAAPAAVLLSFVEQCTRSKPCEATKAEFLIFQLAELAALGHWSYAHHFS